jgi:predicted phosphodiesterase
VKILALSDQVVPYVYSPEAKDRFRDIGLIAGCGDLPASYLEYVVSVLNAPMVYVPGNHDPDRYRVQGGVDLDASFAVFNGVAVAGLGGSPRYKEVGQHQYTEFEMDLRALRLLPRLLLRGRADHPRSCARNP